MKRLYRILALSLALTSILLLFIDMELWSIPCLIMFLVCTYKGRKE